MTLLLTGDVNIGNTNVGEKGCTHEDSPDKDSPEDDSSDELLLLGVTVPAEGDTPASYDCHLCDLKYKKKIWLYNHIKIEHSIVVSRGKYILCTLLCICTLLFTL